MLKAILGVCKVSSIENGNISASEFVAATMGFKLQPVENIRDYFNEPTRDYRGGLLKAVAKSRR